MKKSKRITKRQKKALTDTIKKMCGNNVKEFGEPTFAAITRQRVLPPGRAVAAGAPVNGAIGVQ